MRIINTFLILICALVAGYGGARLAAPPDKTASITQRESVYERVMRTSELRCGYMLYEPMVYKDPNSGTFSGVAVDLAAELGKLLNIKFIWAEETGWGTAIEGLRTGRYDALCVGFWRLAIEGKYLYYTQPFAYSLNEILVRANDTRFDGDLAAINAAQVRIVSVDGMEASRIARRDFAQAQLIELPNLQSDSDMMEAVANNKADVTFIEAATSDRYMSANPGKLKKLKLPAPIRIFQNTFALPQDERLKAMLDTALNELIENGGMDIILDRYDPTRKTLLRIKRPSLQ
jgi:ABC-type amino acid transport substrate-binding protein